MRFLHVKNIYIFRTCKIPWYWDKIDKKIKKCALSSLQTLTWDPVGHIPVISQVLSTNQHKLWTFLLGILDVHQLGNTKLSCNIVTGHHYILLLNSCR